MTEITRSESQSRSRTAAPQSELNEFIERFAEMLVAAYTRDVLRNEGKGRGNESE
jgi:hypothetical protein